MLTLTRRVDSSGDAAEAEAAENVGASNEKEDLVNARIHQGYNRQDQTKKKKKMKKKKRTKKKKRRRKKNME